MDVMSKSYSNKDVEKIVGIPPRRIQFYTESGLIKLEEEMPGRGRERRYTTQNLFEFLIIKELYRYKVALSSIKKLLVERPTKSPESHNVFKFEYVKKRIASQKNKSRKILYCIISDDSGNLFFHNQMFANGSENSIEINLENRASLLIISLNYLVDRLDLLLNK